MVAIELCIHVETHHTLILILLRIFAIIGQDIADKF